jgi:uncharacterized integral membrane protein
MRAIGRLVLIALLLLLAVLLVVFAVANRAETPVALDPFGGEVLAVRVPLYGLAFAALAIGVVIGGFATWLTQAKWRRTARQLRAELARRRAG